MLGGRSRPNPKLGGMHNVLLPDDYFSTSWRRYPVMYLLHGGAQDFRKFDMEDDIRGLDGDVGAGADGDADIGLRQRGGVVYAVADEGDADTALLQRPDRVDLAVHGDPIGLYDADRMRQAISNLVANSLEHGTAGTDAQAEVLPATCLQPVGFGRGRTATRPAIDEDRDAA